MGLGMSLIMTLIITYINTGYDELYYKRFLKDPNTEWAINHHVAKSGQDKFAREVYDYVRQNDILLRKE